MSEGPARPGAQPKPALPKRFYSQAGIEMREGAFVLVLDGRPARTPGRAPLAVATQGLGEALAQEWQAQSEVIDPARMPITRLINSAVDGVAGRMEEVRADLVRYAGSDLVCYRAGEPERLVAAQGAVWDPILSWARETFGARFALAEGLMFAPQPDEVLHPIREALARETVPERLAALHVMTTLSGSLLIPLAHVARRLPAEEAWSAAHVDELFQESRWGEDAEAVLRRQTRWRDFEAASQVYALAGPR